VVVYKLLSAVESEEDGYVDALVVMHQLWIKSAVLPLRNIGMM
jgi:hypothetical protein